MRLNIVKTLFLSFVLLSLISACAPDVLEDNQTAVVEVSPTPETQIINVSTPEATQAPLVTTLEIWWPDRLAPVDDILVSELLSEQIEAFRTSEENVEIEFRLKRAQEVGGILSTLRTASSVAPNALPDITLIRREDLLNAAQAGLIQPIEGLVSSTLITELYPSALQLGRVRVGDQTSLQLYGLAYLLDTQIMAYQLEEDALPVTSWTFEDILTGGLTYAFPAARSTSIPDSFLIQYLAAGGDLSSASTNGLDADALEQVLSFYENAFEEGLVNMDVSTYSGPQDYIPMLASGALDSGVINVSSFAELSRTNRDLRMGGIPTSTGEPAGILNGWLWVIVTPNTDQQVLAARFINWMMDIDRQAQYSETIRILPSQQNALIQWDDDMLDVDLLNQILNNSILAPIEGLNNPVYRAMQNALISVITGQNTAEEAIESISAQLSG